MAARIGFASELVLIHAPFERDGPLIQESLGSARLEGELCSSMSALDERIGGDAGAAIIGDETLGVASIETLVQRLRDQPPWSDFPLIIITSSGAGRQDSPDHLRRFEPLGNMTLLERPLRAETLVIAVRAALRARRYQYQVRDHLEQRERDAQALGESEARYRMLAETLPQLVWTCLPDGFCDYLSSQWVAYTGISQTDQLGLNWLNLVMHPEDRDRTYEAWMAAVADRAEYDIEYRLRRFDGVYRWFKTRGSPMRDSTGRIVKWFGTCTDIEDRKRAEEDRRALLDRERSARRTAELLNRVGPILLRELEPQKLTQNVIDIATQVTGAQFGAFFHNLVNEQGESYVLYTLSGVPREAFSRFPMPRNTEVFAPTFHNQGVVRSDDITQDPRYGKNAPHHGMPEGHLPVRSYLAVSVVSRSGQVLGGIFFGHSNVGVFTEEHEAIVSGIAAQAAVALDNSRLFMESRLAKETIQRSNEELRETNAELQQFAFSASHDLQEPLRMVAIYSQMLKKKYAGRLDADADEYIRYTVDGATRMEQLLKDLLLYTQLTNIAGRPSELVSAHEAMLHALGNLHAAIRDSGAEVEYDRLPEVRVHPIHLRQLFQNLVGNALKYRGEQTPRIQIRCQRRDTQWLFYVADNGIGIDKNYTQQIFGIFRRLHGSSEYSGTGIGLAICKKIVDRYGGKIWVESEPGEGSTFLFTIPDS